MSEFLLRTASQLKALRNLVEVARGEAEEELESLETRPGTNTRALEAQTRALERLESVLECLDEAIHHCTEA